MNHQPASSDPFEMDDAAYLLGALSPVERSQYEQHLQGCPTCSRSVAELAGLPGILRRLPVEVVESMEAEASAAEDHPVPPAVLAGALHRVELEERRERRLRTARWLTAAALGAAAATIGFIAVTDPGGEAAPVAQTPSPTVTPPPPPTAELELEPEVDTSMSANISLREVAWGTKVQLECAYPEEGGGDPFAGTAGYSLVVYDTGGASQQIATWNGVPGRELTIDAATAVRGDDIAALEVRSQDGTTILRTVGGPPAEPSA